MSKKLVEVAITEQEKSMLDIMRKHKLDSEKVLNMVDEKLRDNYLTWYKMYKKAQDMKENNYEYYRDNYLQQFDNYIKYTEDKKALGILQWWER